MPEPIKTSSSRSRATSVSNPSITHEAEELGRSMLDEGAELGSAMLAVVQDNANAFFREQRDRAADEIGALGELLHSSVHSMQRRDGIVARCAEETASQVEGFADWLRSRSWSELTGDVEGLARRYPLSFISAATGMAFVAVRLLTASADRSGQQPMDEQKRSATAQATGFSERARGIMTGETDVVAGVSGGAATGHGAGPVGEE